MEGSCLQVEANEERVRAAKLQEALYRHYASSGVPKGLHCLALKLTVEYSSNARARRDLPSADLAPRLTDPTLHHLVLATDNVLAASVVVTSTVHNAANPEKIVFHVITDKKMYAAMHAWFSLNPLSQAIVEVKGVHQFDWLTRANVPVLEAMETSDDIKWYYHGDHAAGTNISQYSPTILAAYLQARSPKYISIMNHLRIYLPEVCNPFFLAFANPLFSFSKRGSLNTGYYCVCPILKLNGLLLLATVHVCSFSLNWRRWYFWMMT